jgi:hypothetical protein
MVQSAGLLSTKLKPSAAFGGVPGNFGSRRAGRLEETWSSGYKPSRSFARQKISRTSTIPPGAMVSRGEGRAPPRGARVGLLVRALSRICGEVIRAQATEGSCLETLTYAIAEG